jgi:hypothetical protein
VVRVTGSHQEVVGLVTVGHDGQEAAGNEEPHSGHLHAVGILGSVKRFRFIGTGL